MRFSYPGKFLLRFIIVAVVVLFPVVFWLLGIEIAWRVGLIGLGLIGFLLLVKAAGNNDGLVWFLGAGLALFLLVAFGGRNYGANLVENQIPSSDWIVIDGTQYLMREDGSFGYVENQQFVQAGWLNGRSMTFQNRRFSVNGFFPSWPIIVTGNLGEKFEISFR